MIDGMAKGIGNSRYLKSAIPPNITFEQFVEMFRNGTFPVDFNGINMDGWDELPTWLNKANLLTDETASIIDSTNPPETVNESFNKLANNGNDLSSQYNNIASDVATKMPVEPTMFTDATDLNTLVTPGFYHQNGGLTAINAPTSGINVLHVMRHGRAAGGAGVTQVFTNAGGRQWIRSSELTTPGGGTPTGQWSVWSENSIVSAAALTNIGYINGFSANANTDNTFFRTQHGFCVVNMGASRNTDITTTVRVGVLPAGFRPRARIDQVVLTTGNAGATRHFAQLSFLTDGNIDLIPLAGNPAGIRFFGASVVFACG